MRYILINIAFCFLFASCKQTSDIRIEYKEGTSIVSFSNSKKYLLIPIEDKGQEVNVEIATGQGSREEYIIRLAKDRIDYWVPLALSDTKSEDIRLTVHHVDETFIGLKKLRLSDSFEFEANEKFRPGYHFSAPYGWVNDPNGMVYYEGKYHLFYQHNPFGTRWQNMSWGHAISKDLVHWEHQPVAIRPDTLGTIFSGSAVVDVHNTAGLQSGKEKTLLAFYTQSERGGQWQSVAYSNDKGRTWKKYDKNPVLKHPTARDFRDPKVFWHEASHQWIMALAVGQVIELYSSPNAIDWTYESQFGENYGSHGGVWECPDLFELPVEGSKESKWVLLVNINPGAPFGGSGTQYFVGDFDGKNFTCLNKPEESHWMDYGKDHYAAVSWSDAPDNRRIAIAWMSNWQYANDVPTQHFRNTMSVPRELRLIRNGTDYCLSNYPVAECNRLRGKESVYTDIQVKEEYNIDPFLNENTGQYEIILTIQTQSAEIIGFALNNSETGEFTDLYISLPEKRWYVDRKNSGTVDFSTDFPAITYAPLAKKDSYQLRVLVDKASIECFEGNGEVSMTNLIFPDKPYNRIRFYAKGGEYTLSRLEIYPVNQNRVSND